MKILGIIAEYNPFHNGHAYHLKKSKEEVGADVTVAVMSGNFVQRGEPAVLNKWIRSEMAVRNGVDLVLELPFVFACNNAEIFAKGSVNLINSLGCVDYLSFGSEEGEVQPLEKIADFLEPESEEFSSAVREFAGEGISYPRAREKALSLLLGQKYGQLLKSPNNILGIEYLKQIKVLNSHVNPVTITRHGASVNETDPLTSIAGATAIRRLLDDGKYDEALKYLTTPSQKMIEDNKNIITDLEQFNQLLIYSIFTKSDDQLMDIYSITEGLENKVRDSAKDATSVNDLIKLIKSKRYTETRIKRILIHILLNLTKSSTSRIIDENQMYTRVLAFNEKGASLLKSIKKEECSEIPIITNIRKERDMLDGCQDLFDYDILASDIYNLVTFGSVGENSEYRQIPAYVR